MFTHKHYHQPIYPLHFCFSDQCRNNHGDVEPSDRRWLICRPIRLPLPEYFWYTEQHKDDSFSGIIFPSVTSLPFPYCISVIWTATCRNLPSSSSLLVIANNSSQWEIWSDHMVDLLWGEGGGVMIRSFRHSFRGRSQRVLSWGRFPRTIRRRTFPSRTRCLLLLAPARHRSGVYTSTMHGT